MRIGVVGCGLIGNRRASVAHAQGDTVVMVADVVGERAQKTAEEVGARATTDWRAVVADENIEAVVVSTQNKWLAEISIAALIAEKHVLCEKPLGRDAGEAAAIVEAAKSAGRNLKTGFNHRHHPALQQAHSLAHEGVVGPLFAVRGTYGHGGRPGYDQEWRGDPELAGGGELLDQGVHLIDLCRWFLGEIDEVSGMLATSVWKVAPLEDNAFVLMRTSSGQTAALHTSWTQWKNMFRFELFGDKGFLEIDGLGGSYGVERLTLGTRALQGGPPELETWEFPGPDKSWSEEWAEFKNSVIEGRSPLGCGDDGLATARIVDAIYRSSRAGQNAKVSG